MSVAQHYGRARLKDTILQAVTDTAAKGGELTFEDLAAVDEFHVGGLEATRHLAAQMELRPGLRLLDVGAGIGGPARYLAAEHGCKVTGVDLTQEFVETAGELTRLLRLDDAVDIQETNASSLPFEPETFDRAYMIHVGMNIADKIGVFREVRRVLKPGGLFAIFDIMRSATGALRYPVPWALSEDTSFVVEAKDYVSALEAAGFRVEQQQDRTAFAIEFTRRAMARMAESGPPVLGLQLLMGEKTQAMVGNVFVLMQQGILSAVELIARD